MLRQIRGGGVTHHNTSHPQSKKKRTQGFTLVELIVVVVILAIIIGVAITGIFKYVKDARVNTDINNASAMQKVISAATIEKDIIQATKDLPSGDSYEITWVDQQKFEDNTIKASQSTGTDATLNKTLPSEIIQYMKNMLPDGLPESKSGEGFTISISKNELDEVVCKVTTSADTSSKESEENEGVKIPEGFIDSMLGKYYKFAGYEWMAAERIDDKSIVLQSTGVTHGSWPGYRMTKYGNGSIYDKDIDGEDISDYDSTMQTLFNNIKSAERTQATYGKGLYLIHDSKLGHSYGWIGAGNYYDAVVKAANNASNVGGYFVFAYVGNIGVDPDVHGINGHQQLDEHMGQNNDYVIAPAFNLDLTKVDIDQDNLTITVK